MPLSGIIIMEMTLFRAFCDIFTGYKQGQTVWCLASMFFIEGFSANVVKNGRENVLSCTMFK